MTGSSCHRGNAAGGRSSFRSDSSSEGWIPSQGSVVRRHEVQGRARGLSEAPDRPVDRCTGQFLPAPRPVPCRSSPGPVRGSAPGQEADGGLRRLPGWGRARGSAHRQSPWLHCCYHRAPRFFGRIHRGQTRGCL